jgi:hypothetical protein
MNQKIEQKSLGAKLRLFASATKNAYSPGLVIRLGPVFLMQKGRCLVGHERRHIKVIKVIFLKPHVSLGQVWRCENPLNLG